jgi:NADH-quinone oxidoreductase subunit G
MRVWFLKETKSICTSCATGCNMVVGSRENRVYRYEPRENDAVNSCWMCDYGRLNYKWIDRESRLAQVTRRTISGVQEPISWEVAMREIAELLNRVPNGSTAIIGSARQTTEELYLLSKLKAKLGAISDSIARSGEADRLLLNSDRNPNASGAKLTGISADPMGSNIPQIVNGIRNGNIRTLIVFGEDVTKHGISPNLLGELKTLIVSDILPSATTARAHYVLPGCAHAEKRGTFINGKGRVQRFLKAIEPKGDSRAEWEILHELVLHVTGQNGFVSIEGLFNQMAAEIPRLNGVTWASLGDTGVTVDI